MACLTPLKSARSMSSEMSLVFNHFHGRCTAADRATQAALGDDGLEANSRIDHQCRAGIRGTQTRDKTLSVETVVGMQGGHHEVV